MGREEFFAKWRRNIIRRSSITMGDSWVFFKNEYRCQLGPTELSSHKTKSFDIILVTALLMEIPGDELGPATVGFALNCQVRMGWTTEEH